MSLLGHPFGARKMTLICGTRTIRLLLRIDVQDDSSDLSPVRALTLRLQKANVRHDMLFVVGRQSRLVRRDIRDVRI
ncbi:hypothetical protein BLN97_12390 [Bradyrhizobium elkanii]|nr:hypothetical protein BLN97_12390 [Bradyrhizobium elkanii]